MTDKELKKLSRLELLELLLAESRENERLRAELDKLKQENLIAKSAENLNETSKQLETALKKVSSMINSIRQNPSGADQSENTSSDADKKQKKKNKKERRNKKKNKIENA